MLCIPVVIYTMVSSACIIDSVLENFKSQLGIISDNLVFKGLVIEFRPHCIKICSSKVVVFFLMLYFPFLVLFKIGLLCGLLFCFLLSGLKLILLP